MISPKQLMQAVIYAPYQDAVMAVSPPGTAKSSIMHAAARYMGYKYLPRYTATLEASDVRLPYVEDDPSGIKVAKWAVSTLLPIQALEKSYPRDTHFLVNFDDFPHASPSVMRPFVRSIYGDGAERVIAEFPILNRVRFVLTGNRAEDRAGSNRLDTYITNRLVIFDIEPDVDEWVSGALGGFPLPETNPDYPDVRATIDKAVRQGIPDELIAYVKWTKQVYDFSPDVRSFKSPRSLEQLGRFIRAYEASPMEEADRDALIMSAACGTLGEAEAIKFAAFRSLREKLPDTQAILEGKEVKLPLGTDILFILATQVVRAAQEKHVPGVAKLFSRLLELKSDEGFPAGVEVSAYLAHECLVGAAAKRLEGIKTYTDPTTKKMPFMQWLQKYGKDYVIG